MHVNNKFNLALEKIKNLNSESSSVMGLLENLTGNDLIFYKYASITFTDTERNFSRFKNNTSRQLAIIRFRKHKTH